MRRTLIALAVVLWSDPSWAAEPGAARQDVKFSCTQHGPSHMNVTLAIEAASGSARAVEVIGAATSAKWTVKIDGIDQETPNNGTVRVRPGDTITWKVTGSRHGVMFADGAVAQAEMEFDQAMGKDRKGRPDLAPGFGSRPWGTDAFRAADAPILAVCKVKVAVTD